MMYIINNVIEKIVDYNFAVLEYQETNNWDFDQNIKLEGKDLGLFSSNLNFHLNSVLNKKNETNFISFYGNRYNPNEINLLTLLFEKLDELLIDNDCVVVCKYFYKPETVKNNPLVTIENKSIYNKSGFIHDFLLVDYDFTQLNPQYRQIILLTLKLKKLLLNHIEDISLMYFADIFIECNIFLNSYLSKLFSSHLEDGELGMLELNSKLFSYILHSFSFSKKILNDGDVEEIRDLIFKISLNIKYPLIDKSYFAEHCGELVLSQALKEVYLKCNQQFFWDSEWPFLDQLLIKELRRNNKQIVNKLKKKISTENIII